MADRRSYDTVLAYYRSQIRADKLHAAASCSMNSLSQVVWSEGMYLGPHEFQAQARYFESAIHFAATSLWFRCYGLTGYGLDSDALRNGTLSLLHGSGIFPDGTPFEIAGADARPHERQIADLFPPTQDSLIVSIGMTKRKAQGRNTSLSDAPEDARYLAELRAFNDETNGGDPRQVRIRRKNIRLLLETELTDDVVSIPIARVKRDGKGHFVFDPEFVPPCLHISASERLMMLLQRIIEILEAKSTALSRTGKGDIAAFSSRDLSNFWLMHAVNSGLAPLRHHWISKRGHPEEVFMEMSRLAGALCTFALESHPNTLPVYDHEHLGDCFGALDIHIRTHLETIVPTNCVSIPLTKTADYFYEGDIVDARCLSRATWVLGIQSRMGDSELILRTPQLVKICSAKFIGELVKRAIAGLALNHLPIPPSAISTTVGTQYFRVSHEGPFWDHIVQTKRVGIYVPEDLPDAKLELLVLLDQ